MDEVMMSAGEAAEYKPETDGIHSDESVSEPPYTEDFAEDNAAQNTPTDEAEEISTDDASGEKVEQITDYREIVESDLAALRRAYPDAVGIESITDLKNPLRYAELRDLGLSPGEAYLATGGRKRKTDNRAHLSSAVPRSAGSPRSNMSYGELERARELFPGLGDRELHGLYKKVSV